MVMMILLNKKCVLLFEKIVISALHQINILSVWMENIVVPSMKIAFVHLKKFLTTDTEWLSDKFHIAVDHVSWKTE